MNFIDNVGHYAWATLLWAWLGLQTASAWVEAWPATFVGVVVGGLLTLIGVALTNIINLRNLEKQLQHNRDEKARERAFSVRQDIYIGASEAISAGLSVLSDAGNLAISGEDLMKDFRAMNGQSRKVHIVATETTGILLMGFMHELAKTLIGMTLKRAELTGLQSQIQDRKSRIKSGDVEIDRLIGMMKHHNIDGTMDERRLKVLQGNVEFMQGQRDGHQREIDKMVDILRPRHMVFFDECQHEAVRMTQLLPPLVASIRRELDLPIDIETYRKAMLNEPVIGKEQLEQIFGMKMPEKTVKVAI